MGKTKIEWAHTSWNPVTGCSPVSEGCKNCYAKRLSSRLAGRYGYPKDEPFKVTAHYERLQEPLLWKKPRLIFVCSMGDLFHPDVPERFLFDVWDTMVEADQHTYMVLTKRPERMASYWVREKNIWAGVSVENQKAADERIPILLGCPAPVHFVSVEPCLGPVDLTEYLGRNFRQDQQDQQDGKLDWVICGGETGPGARDMAPVWAYNLLKQCREIDTPFFFKQWGSFFAAMRKKMGVEPAANYHLNGAMYREYPEVE